MQADDEIYGELPPSLRKKLQPNTRRSSNSSTPEVKTGFVGLVPIAAGSSIPQKLAGRPLPLVNPSKVSDRRKKELEVKEVERQKRKLASKRRRSGRPVKGDRSAQILRGRKPFVRGRASYALLEPLHQLWLGYVSELLGVDLQTEPSTTSSLDIGMTLDPPSASTTNGSTTEHTITASQAQSWQTKLVKADFHGAKLSVVKAKNPALIGLCGIVAQETEGTFRLVTVKDDVKTIPKLNVTYQFSLPLASTTTQRAAQICFELYGGNFAFKPADRATRKFKNHGVAALDYH